MIKKKKISIQLYLSNTIEPIESVRFSLTRSTEQK